MNERIILPKKIPDSWRDKAELEWFVRGYEYAATQTFAIPAMAETSPSNLFYFICAFLREMGLWDALENCPVNIESFKSNEDEL